MRERLKEVLKIQAVSGNQWRTFAYCVRKAKALGATVEKDLFGNLYITKGEADVYPCVVAHMDTVHDIVDDLQMLDCGHKITGFNSITMTQTGIGGDDKVGIFIALECLALFDNIKVAFFVDEEIGCEGSYEADIKWFKDCSFVLQCDRRGNDDFVTNAGGIPLSSKAFHNDIAEILFQFGYKHANGMMTDVMALKEMGIECCVANMSCGYYNPHCKNEYVDVRDVENCLDMVKQIIVTCGGIMYLHKYEKPVPQYSRFDYSQRDYWLQGSTGERKTWHNENAWERFSNDAKDEEDQYEYELCEDCARPTNHTSGLCIDCLEYYDLYDNDFPITAKPPIKPLQNPNPLPPQNGKIIPVKKKSISEVYKELTAPKRKFKNKNIYIDKRNFR